ncbi:MAG TPA: FkbM family methyltransferase [Longimicrobiaceae bacterium]|nr:FkbM family methyltransferase [Longimicrobiaceae bacterium]
MNLRAMRRKLARWVPEWLKARYRARLFGYGTPPGSAGTVREENGHLLVSFDGLEMRVPAAAAADVRYHFVENADSVEEIRGLLRAARETGGVLMDVGAMRGLLAAAWILARPGNRAMAYEPSPAFVRDLQRLAELNGLGERFHSVTAAVGRAPGTVRAGVDAMGLIDFAPVAGAETFAAAITSLDAECARVGMPDAVKVDVEGDELEVLAGARELLEARRPLLFLELHLDELERRGLAAGGVAELLGPLGYRFETSQGEPLAAAALARSPKAVLRVVARPGPG